MKIPKENKMDIKMSRFTDLTFAIFIAIAAGITLLLSSITVTVILIVFLVGSWVFGVTRTEFKHREGEIQKEKLQ
jgi:hypothetical protein